MKEVCLDAKERWDTDRTILPYWVIETYSSVTLKIKPLLPLPNLEPTFCMALENFKDMQDGSETLARSDINEINSSLDILKIIGVNEPRLFLQYNFPTVIEGEMLSIISSTQNYISVPVDTEMDVEELDKDKDYLEDTLELLSTMESVTKSLADQITDLISDVENHLWEIESAIEEKKEAEVDEDAQYISNDSDNRVEIDLFSIDQLFEDI